jgi:hypothetical protein
MREAATDAPTVRAFRDSWRRMYPNGQANKPREPSTWIVYMERTKKFAELYGQQAMSSITKRQARAWSIEHPGSIGPLRAMFSDAVRDEVIEQNPFADLRLGRAPGRRNIQPISEAQFGTLLGAAARIGGPSFRAICALSGAAARREAETFAVCVEDVDFPAEEIRVGWQFRSKVKRPTPGEPDRRWAPPRTARRARSLYRLWQLRRYARCPSRSTGQFVLTGPASGCSRQMAATTPLGRTSTGGCR